MMQQGNKKSETQAVGCNLSYVFLMEGLKIAMQMEYHITQRKFFV